MLTLVLLLVGGLIIAPLLGFMGTGLIAGQVHEKRMDELYAADAGVEYAIWKIVRNGPELPHDACRDMPWSLNYTIPDVNERRVGGSIDYLTEEVYRITSVATTDSNSTTTVESYVELMVLDLFSGALVSSGSIGFHKDCTVTGDVYYVGEITGEEYVHLDGHEIQVSLDAFPTQEENEAFAQQLKDEALAGGTHTGDMTIDSDRSLGPRYITGNLDIGTKGITVTLTGTIYVEGEIRASKEYTITGSGSIVAVGDIYLSKLADYGTEGDTIIMSLNGDITFKKECTLEALIYAPNGTIQFDKDATVVGSVIGADIQVDKDVSFNYISKGASFELFVWVPYGAEIKSYIINP